MYEAFGCQPSLGSILTDTHRQIRMTEEEEWFLVLIFFVAVLPKRKLKGYKMFSHETAFKRFLFPCSYTWARSGWVGRQGEKVSPLWTRFCDLPLRNLCSYASRSDNWPTFLAEGPLGPSACPCVHVVHLDQNSFRIPKYFISSFHHN